MEACLSIKFAYLDWLTCKKCLLGGHGKARRTVVEMFLRNKKGNEREVQIIEPTELNKRLAHFMPFCKDRGDYKISSLRCLVTN